MCLKAVPASLTLSGCSCECSTDKEGANWLFLTPSKQPLTSPLTGGAVRHHQGPGPYSFHGSSKPPWTAGGTLYLWLFCSWQGSSVAAVEGIHIPMASSPPGWMALWLSPVPVLLPALGVGPGMAGTPGLMEPTPIWKSELLPCSRLAAPLSFCPFAGSAVILWLLCLSQHLGSGTQRGDKSLHTRTVIYLLPQPRWALVKPLSSAVASPFCFHLLTFF